MLAALGLVAVMLLVGKRVLKTWRRRAIVSAIPEGELRERFAKAYEAWSHAKETAA